MSMITRPSFPFPSLTRYTTRVSPVLPSAPMDTSLSGPLTTPSTRAASHRPLPPTQSSHTGRIFALVAVATTQVLTSASLLQQVDQLQIVSSISNGALPTITVV